MNDRVHLIGAEDVRSAGATIARAADDMQQAARNFDGTVERLGGAMQGFGQIILEAADKQERAAVLAIKAEIAAAEIAGMTASNENTKYYGCAPKYVEHDFKIVADRLRQEVQS